MVAKELENGAKMKVTVSQMEEKCSSDGAIIQTKINEHEAVECDG